MSETGRYIRKSAFVIFILILIPPFYKLFDFLRFSVIRAEVQNIFLAPMGYWLDTDKNSFIMFISFSSLLLISVFWFVIRRGLYKNFHLYILFLFLLVEAIPLFTIRNIDGMFLFYYLLLLAAFFTFFILCDESHRIIDSPKR